jgi:hypothetical protein
VLDIAYNCVLLSPTPVANPLISQPSWNGPLRAIAMLLSHKKDQFQHISGAWF